MRMMLKRNRKPERVKKRSGEGYNRKTVDAETATLSDVFWSLSPRLRSILVVFFFLLVFYWTFWEAPILVSLDAAEGEDGGHDLGGILHAQNTGKTETVVNSNSARKISEEAHKAETSGSTTSGESHQQPNEESPHSAPANIETQGSFTSESLKPATVESSVITASSGIQADTVDTVSSTGATGGMKATWQSKRLPGESQTCFALGGKQDHLCTFTPLCIEPDTLQLVMISGLKGCAASNRSADWLHSKCNHIREDALKEVVFPTVTERSSSWLEVKERETGITWIEGGTILQMLERNCGNIAHYTGRIFFAHHVLSNAGAYFSEPSALRNFLIWPGVDVMKRFVSPEKYAQWHKNVLEAIVYPNKPVISSLQAFALENQHTSPGQLNVRLLDDAVGMGNRPLCFRQAVIPGYMKGRYFAADTEYPSDESTSVRPFPEAPSLPRDALKFRRKVSHLLRGTPTVEKPLRKIVFLDRAQAAAARRAIEPSSKERLFSLLKLRAAQNGYVFKPIIFEDLNFSEQEEAMKDVAIAIGVHGANLVNCVLQPPYTVLLELMPYQFEHLMYVEAGHAGIKYYTHQMTTGVEAPNRNQFTSAAECISRDHDCKVHYRDQRLNFQQEDLTTVDRIVADAFTYLAKMEEAGHLKFA